jgi:hypothetical protein
VLRVLLHDTSTSHSLLSQLGVKDTLRFVDTRREPLTPPGAIVLTANDWPSGDGRRPCNARAGSRCRR